jgi:hypothetical protein
VYGVGAESCPENRRRRVSAGVYGLQWIAACKFWQEVREGTNSRLVGKMKLKVSFMFSSIQLDRNTNSLSSSIIVRLGPFITNSFHSLSVTPCIPPVVATWSSANDSCAFEDAAKSPQFRKVAISESRRLPPQIVHFHPLSSITFGRSCKIHCAFDTLPATSSTLMTPGNLPQACGRA